MLHILQVHDIQSMSYRHKSVKKFSPNGKKCGCGRMFNPTSNGEANSCGLCNTTPFSKVLSIAINKNLF
jgi:hypothetical protein